VLIVGCGMTYHNVQTFMANRDAKSRAPDAGSQGFDDWLEEVLTRETPVGRVAALTAWDKAPSARDAHPREEHLLPLHVVVGAAGFDPGRRGGGVSFSIRLKLARQAPAAALATYCLRYACAVLLNLET
jgi:aromatic ring-opening dioxygenase catalytic subunit (LigB family)